MLDIQSQFPFFKNNTDITYLDSAATSQKPFLVINQVNQYLSKVANPGRNGYGVSYDLNIQIELTRKKIANFLGTKSNNIAFTKGATDGINIITRSLATSVLQGGGEVLLCSDDHKATILPWINLQKNLETQGVNIKIINYKTDPFTGLINAKDLLSKINIRTKFVVLTHAHNVFGVVNNIKSIITHIPNHVITVLDVAQTVGHTKVNFEELGVDLAVFSGHKMFSLEGIGGLYASNRVNNLFSQTSFGGGVEIDTFPYILEVGTKNTIGIISLGAAVDFVNDIGIDNIKSETQNLTSELLSKLQNIKGLSFLAGIAFDQKLESTGIVSFASNSDQDRIIYELNENKINIRIGKHCTQRDTDSIRVSLHAYNNSKCIDRLVSTLSRCL